MSYGSTIYAGDAVKIMPLVETTADLRNADFVIGTTELSRIHSYHLESFMQLLGDPSTKFMSYVADTKAPEDGEWYAHVMQPSFAALFAALTDKQIADTVPRWLEALNGRAEPDAIAGCNKQLRQLAELCRTAIERRADTVFSCWL